MTSPMVRPFDERLRAAVAESGNTLCVGIDPPVRPAHAFLAGELQRRGAERYLEAYGEALVAAAVEARAPIVKPQSAFFEAFGAEGLSALRYVLAKASESGLLTILDAKRGDISSTMSAYGRAAFDVMRADALTVTPYMGFDVIEPLLPWLTTGRGVYVVWVSSNASGRVVQEAELASGGWLAATLWREFRRGFEAADALGALGLVLGATKLDSMPADLLAEIQRRPLLMPGVGAQGATVTPELRRVLAGSGASVVSVSRSISDLASSDSVESWDAYTALIAKRACAIAATLSV
jgi:orotidine-5'-phosphate decarboxylase